MTSHSVTQGGDYIFVAGSNLKVAHVNEAVASYRLLPLSRLGLRLFSLFASTFFCCTQFYYTIIPIPDLFEPIHDN